jgi:hypothetical protein
MKLDLQKRGLTFEMRKRTALHEASHVVAVRVYGLPINFAEVCADDCLP